MVSHNSPAAVAEILGSRLKQARLNADYTQAKIATMTGLSRRTVINAEKGSVTLEALIAILMALDLSDQLELLLPVQSISPLQLAKLQGSRRKRASGQRDPDHEEGAQW